MRSIRICIYFSQFLRTKDIELGKYVAKSVHSMSNDLFIYQHYTTSSKSRNWKFNCELKNYFNLENNNHCIITTFQYTSRRERTL